MSSLATGSTHRLGEVLLSRNLVSESQLEAAIAEQRESKLQLGQILVDQRIISERQLRRCLKRQTILRKAVLFAALSVTPLQYVHAEDSQTSPKSSIEQPQTEALDRPEIPSGNWLPDNYFRTSGPGLGWGRSSSLIARSGIPASSFISTGAPTLGALDFNTNQPSNKTGWDLIKGQYRGGVAEKEEGFRYKLKWSKKSVKLEAKYQF